MYQYLKGILTRREPAFLVVECNGVGYLLKTTLHTYSALSEGETVTVYTHLQIREDAHTLFGFATQRERDTFVALLEVSGVGSATALVILSSLTPDQIRQAVLSEDEAKFQNIKGIGIKTAKRLILELKDKLARLDAETVLSPPSLSTPAQEAVTALVALGFAKSVAEKQVQTLLAVSPSLTTEELIRKCLTAAV